MTRPSPAVGAAAASLGAALGAVSRWSLEDALPVPAHAFPWTTFAINVVGSALLAGLPLLGLVRSSPWLAVFLGTGVLGGFTTMSAASVDTFSLFDAGETALGAAYALGTAGAALLAVLLVGRVTTADERARVEAEEGDE